MKVVLLVSYSKRLIYFMKFWNISNSFNLIPFPNVNVATMCIKRKLQCTSTYTLFRNSGMSGQINCLEKCFKFIGFYKTKKTYVTSSSHIVCGFFGANAGSFALIWPIFKRSIDASFSWWTFLEKSRKKYELW